MTKVGEGKDWPNEPGIDAYHKEINVSADKFITALGAYQNNSATTPEKEQFRAIMDQNLAIIRSAVAELKRAGIYKQEVKVENDYAAYIKDNSLENLSALEQDLQTLKEYNQLP